MLSLKATLAIPALALLSGCAGPPITGAIEGEPVCADFKDGALTMEGGLRYPVRLRVLDGSRSLFRTVLRGHRRADAQSKTLIIDDNITLNLEWAQCENERAPRSASDAAREDKAREGKGHEIKESGYECGEAKVYKTVPITLKKGDKASHTIQYVPPPNATCLKGEEAPAPAPKATASASAALPPEPISDAGSPAAARGEDGDAGPADAGPNPTK